METPKKPVSSSAVDNILQELKSKGGTKPAAQGGRSVDDILAEMGRGGSLPLPKKPSAPAGNAGQIATAEQAAKAKQAAQTEAPAPVQKPPVEKAPPPAAKPAPAPVHRTAPTAQPDDDFEEDYFAEAEEEPAPRPQPAKRPAPKPGATIWDIETQHSDPEPRTGKAAALDKVDPGKYSGDTELLSWFADEEEDEGLSKKEQRQLAKEEKRRAAEERKEEKRRLAEQRKEEKRRRKMGEEDEDDEDDYDGFPDLPPLRGSSGYTAASGQAYTDEDDSEDEAYYDEEDYADDIEDPYEDEDFAQPTQSSQAAHSAPSRAASPAPAATVAMAEDTFAFEAVRPAGSAQPPATDATLGFSAEETEAEPALFSATAATEIFGGSTGDNATLGFAAAEATMAFEAVPDADDAANTGSATREMPLPPGADPDTQSYALGAEEQPRRRVPSAAFTHEFDGEEVQDKSRPAAERLFLNDMVDDKFKTMFETPAANSTLTQEQAARNKRRRKKSRSAIITGEFAKLAELSEQADDDDSDWESEDEFEDYNHLQQAEEIEGDIAILCDTLNRRTIFTAIIGALLFWMGLSFGGLVPLPQFMAYAHNPIVFSIVYIVLLLAAIGINFTTVATGLVGLAGEPTVDSPPALAAVAALLQGVVLLVQAIGQHSAVATLFAGLAAFLLAANALGKRVRAGSILRNFRLASAGFDHSAAYVLDNTQELAHSITDGLDEDEPTLLISRPTALVKGFLRQSFSQRGTDRTGRMLGWVLLGIGVVAGVLTYFFTKELFAAVSALAATLCIGAPLSSSLVSGVPSHLLQKNTSRIGAVVPGWSAIEDLGQVNVVMATARDIFPPSSVYLKGIKTFEKERVDIAILYAASVLIEGCDTLRDIFSGVIQGKNDMLYKVESLTKEPGRGFTAWVQNSRVVIGNREMLQKHAIEPPSIEIEMKYVPDGYYPVYLAVSGKLFAMFIVGYGANPEVLDTLNGLVKSGLSLLVTSDDMNVSSELVEVTYGLPPGVVKVLGRRELEMLKPMTEYRPESEGVMTHIGTFASFIGGMRAAAGCAASERMSSIIQTVSAILGGALCLLLVFSGALSTLGISIALLYQIAWTLLICVLPFARRY